MSRTTLAVLALALSGCVAAQADPQPSASRQPATHETHDWNGDGVLDRAAIVAGDGGLILQFETGGAEGVAQRLALHDDGSLIFPSVTVEDNTLVLEQLTGGTTAVSSTHRFRWDRKMGAMRLIGLDATLYSRTFAHDGRKASWNLLTGDLHTHTLRLRKDDSNLAYDEADKQRRNRNSDPLRLEDSPSGDDLLGWPGGGSQGREGQ